MSAHSRPIGHISLGVPDISSAELFYTAIFAPLGLSLVFESPPGAGVPALGYGPNAEEEIINIFQYGKDARAPGRGTHIAFNALSRQAVADFHEAATQAGGRSDGRPGIRNDYGKNYYAAFIISPEGWRLEAVYKASE